MIGALVMILGQAMARLGAGIPMFPDLLEDAFTRGIPAPIFARVLDALKFQAKPLLFISILILQILVGALLGSGFALLVGGEIPGLRRHWSGWSRGLLGALAGWLATAAVVLPLTGSGFFGVATAVGPLALNVALLSSFALFGLTLAGCYRASVRRFPAVEGEESAASPERRRLLGGLAVGAVAVLSAGATYRIITAGRSGATVTVIPSTGREGPTSGPPLAVLPVASPTADSATTTPIGTAGPAVSAPNPWNIPGLLPEVTPTEKFYVVSKNFFSDPVVDPARWALEIGGLVRKPYRITYDQLLKLPYEDRYQTLECISNEVGGDLIGNARWRGVSLRDLIAIAEPGPSAIKVKFSAADGYTDALPLERALSPANLLAYAMNREPLRPSHGAPVRLLIPGIYGMKNVKWLTRIELVADDYKGYWEQRGWSDEAIIQTTSQINSLDPRHSVVTAGTIELAGIAFAGDRGISKVEVSVDGGTSWQEAVLKEPLGPYTWRLWRWEWKARPGQYHLLVRATDGTGQQQSAVETETLPKGATGFHSKTIRVE